MTHKTVEEHEGRKYLRRVHSAAHPDQWVEADVYAVLEAFGVTCPGRAQAIKKLLCAGRRGKGSALADLEGALAAVSRAIDLQRARESPGESLQEVLGGAEHGGGIYSRSIPASDMAGGMVTVGPDGVERDVHSPPRHEPSGPHTGPATQRAGVVKSAAAYKGGPQPCGPVLPEEECGPVS